MTPLRPSPSLAFGSGLLLGLAALMLGLMLGCTLAFTPQSFQTIQLFFEVTSTLAEGEATVAHSLFVPDGAQLRKRFLSVSGSLDGADLPDRLELVAQTVDAESGKSLSTLKLTLEIEGDGSFAKIRKVKKNLASGSLTTVTVEPLGADLAAGTGVRLCVEIVRRKPDLAASPCGATGTTGSTTTFSAIQEQIFTPSCARGGCHDAAAASEGLVLEAGSAYDNLVGVPSNQVPFRLRVDPGNPDNSYLMKKLLGTADISGVKMPLDGPPFLTDAQLAGIESWIRSGALDN